MPEIKGQDSSRLAMESLLTFLEQYFQFWEAQLEGVRSELQTTVGELRQGLQESNKLRQKMSARAHTVLGLAEGQENADSAGSLPAIKMPPVQQGAELENPQDKRFSGQGEEGLQLSQRIKALSQLDGTIEMLLFSMSEALSSEAAVDQSLEHVRQTMAYTRHGLMQMRVNTSKGFCQQDIHHWFEVLKRQVYRAYTLEAEREAFRSIFQDFS